MNNKVKDDKYTHVLKKDFHNFPLLAPLLQIHQCPTELYIEGDILEKNENTRVVCVIGSRKASPYGREATDHLLSGLQGHDIIIISGLAVGIDTCAHRAAIKYKLKTISFPGSGLDHSVLYPQSNIVLAKEIVTNGGALISEYEPDTKSQLYTFPARNRLMAAVADLILIIEAEEKSGTQITARLGLEYNKDIAIVPGSIFSSLSRGTAQLFKDGAYPVVCSEDILELLKLNSKPEQKTLFETISDEEKTILKMLDYPMSRDDIINGSGLLAHEAFIAITTLESKGFVADSFGEIKKLV
jgi:DNA processing protein